MKLKIKTSSIKNTPKKKISKLANLKPHKGILVGNPKDFVHIDWYQEWKGKRY